MRVSIVIPTYYCRPEYYNPGKKVESFNYFDHPVPLNEEGNLERLLESFQILEIPEKMDLNVIIIPVGNSPDIQEESERKVSRITRKFKNRFKIFLITDSKLERIKACTDKEIFENMVGFQNYSKVRNICILTPFILGSDVAILIDDDEIFEDPGFLKRAVRFIGKKHGDKTVHGIAGYYLNPDPEKPGKWTYFFDVKLISWWERLGRVWNKAFYINKTLKKAVESELSESSFSFGGNLVLSRNLIKSVPFDPQIPRGEDTDYVLNSKIGGYSIYFDRELSIKHSPPVYKSGEWEKLRTDMLRFFLFRSKISYGSLKKIPLEKLMAYPGEFLGNDLELRAFIANVFLSLDYLLRGRIRDLKRSLENILLEIECMKNRKRRKNVMENYLRFQKDWKRLVADLDGKGGKLVKIIKG